MDDPGKLRVSTPALLYLKCTPTLTGMFVLFLTVDDLHCVRCVGVWLCS